MSDATKPEEVKEAPRSTAEADFTKYKVSTLEYFRRAPLDLIRLMRPLNRDVDAPSRRLQI